MHAEGDKQRSFVKAANKEFNALKLPTEAIQINERVSLGPLVASIPQRPGEPSRRDALFWQGVFAARRTCWLQHEADGSSKTKGEHSTLSPVSFYGL